MKTLVVGMQSSGASFVTFCLAQRSQMVAVIDLYCRERAPELNEEAARGDVLLKCTITATIPLAEQIERFRPDRTLLVTRDVDAIRRSLEQKPWRDYAGAMEEKLEVYQGLLQHHLDWFDEVLVYERCVRTAPTIRRRPKDVLAHNQRHSRWCRENYGRRWGFGALRM